MPLAYVIRKEPRDLCLTTTRETEIFYGAPFVGADFDQYSTEVFGIVNQLTFDQNATNWIERRTKVHRDGRYSIIDLCNHCDGGDEKNKKSNCSSTA